MKSVETFNPKSWPRAVKTIVYTVPVPLPVPVSGTEKNKNAAGGIEPPSVNYPNIRTYVSTGTAVLVGTYVMFPAELKSSSPDSQKKKITKVP